MARHALFGFDMGRAMEDEMSDESATSVDMPSQLLKRTVIARERYQPKYGEDQPGVVPKAELRVS